MFSPILASPLVSSQQHKNATIKLDTDCSVGSVSLFGGLDSPCGGKQGAGANGSSGGMPSAEEEEDALVSCSQELFGSPEVCSTTVRGERKEQGVEGDQRKAQVLLEDGQQCLETETSLQYRLSGFQKTSTGLPDSQLQGIITDSVQETPKAQRHLPERSKLVHSLVSERRTCSSSSQYTDKVDQDDLGINLLRIPLGNTSAHDSTKPHSHELLCNPIQSQNSQDSLLHADSKPDHNLDQSDVLDLLFMSCSQLDAHIKNQVNKESNLPPPKLPLLSSLSPPTSARLPTSPPSTESRHPHTSPDITVTSAIDSNEESSSSHAVISTVMSTHGAGGHTLVQSMSKTLPAPPTHGQASQIGHVYTCEDSSDTLRPRLTVGVATELKHTRGNVISHHQEGERPLAVEPQTKRRRLSTKVFQYPDSKQLEGVKKSRKYGSIGDGKDSHACTAGKTPQFSSVNVHITENSPQISSTATRRKSDMVLNTKPPAKRICHEDPGGAERREAEGLNGEEQIVAADIVADDIVGNCGKRLSISNRVDDSKASVRSGAPSDRTELLAAKSVKNSAFHSKSGGGEVSRLPDAVCSSCTTSTVSSPEGQRMLVSSLTFGATYALGVQTSDSTGDSPNRSKVEPAYETFKTSTSPVLSQQKQQKQQQQQQQQDNIIFPGSVDMDPTNLCVAIQQQDNTVVQLASTKGARAPGLRRTGKKWQRKPPSIAPAKPASSLPDMTAAELPQSESVDSEITALGVENLQTGPAEDMRDMNLFRHKVSPKPAAIEDLGAHVSKLHQADLVSAEALLSKDFPELVITKASVDPEVQTEPTPSVPQEPSLDKPSVEIIPLSHNSVPMSDTQVSGKFAGFRTASGHAVHVSEQAMCRAQKLITEELGGGNPTKEESVTTPLLMKEIAANTPFASAFKTPRLVCSVGKLTSQSSFKPLQSGAETPTGSAAVPPRNALSTGRKLTARSFKAPRKVSSVSKEEEAASLARIMRKFGSISALSVQSHPAKLVKGRCGRGGGAGGKSGGRGEAEGGGPGRSEGVSGTAYNMGESVSLSSIQQAQQIINEKESGLEASISPRTSHLQSSNQLTAVGRSESRTSELTNQQIPISGFTTASGRKLTVSSTALEHAHNILSVAGQDIGTGITAEVVCDGRAVRKEIGTVHVGFQTASGKNLSVSSESLARAESLVACIPDNSSANTGTDICNGMMLTGFQTAGGKGITVSANTLEEAKRVVQKREMDVSDQTIMKQRSDAILEAEFQTFKGTTISGSRKAKPLRSAQRDFQPYSQANTVVTGFQTGSGRTLSVSMSSLQQAQNMIGSEPPVETEHIVVNESRVGKLAPDFAEDLHAEGVSTGVQCPALSAEDLDDVDVDNLGAFTQIDFHSPKGPKGEPVNCSQSGDPPTLKDGGNSTAETEVTRNCLDDGLPQEKGCEVVFKEAMSEANCRTSRVEAECLMSNMDRAVSVDGSKPWQLASTNDTLTQPSDKDEQLQQSLMLTTMGADGSQVPDPDGEHSCYFSTQMVRQFLDFSSDEEEEENRSPTEQHCMKEVDTNLTEVHSVVPESASQLVQQFPTVEAGQRGKIQGEDSQAVRSLSEHQDPMPLVKSHLPPSGHGSCILNSQCEQGVQCSQGDSRVRDAVTRAVDELFEVAPNYDQSSISEVAGTDPECNQLHPVHELPKLLPSQQPSLDSPDLQPSSNTSQEDVLSHIHSSSSFQTSFVFHTVGQLDHSPPGRSTKTGSASAECGQQVLQSVPTVECREPEQGDAGLTRLIDSSLARKQFGALSCQQSPSDNQTKIDLPSPTSSRPGCFNVLQNRQEVPLAADLSQQILHLTPQPSTNTVTSTDVPTASPPAQVTSEHSDTFLSTKMNSSHASGETLLLDEVLTESMVDGLGEVMDVSALLERGSVGCSGGVAVREGMRGREDHPKLSMELLPKQDLSPPRMDAPTGTQPLQSPLINDLQQPLRSPHINCPLQTSPTLQTAAGEQINIANEQMDKRGCQGSGGAALSSPVLAEGLQTVGNEDVLTSKEVLSPVNQTVYSVEDKVSEFSIPQDSTHSPPIEVSPYRSFPGLQTASGKGVDISEASLQAARMVIHGKQAGSSSSSSKIPGLMTAKGDQADVSKDALQAVTSTINLDPGLHHAPKRTFPGLQTASGAEVNISSAALLAAKSTLRSIPDLNLRTPITPKHDTFPGLQTASGNHVSISEQSLAAVRETFSGNQPWSSTTLPFSLTTASGNSVHISKRALEAVKQVEGASLSCLKSDSIPHSTVGTPDWESSGTGQVGTVSPITAQQAHAGTTVSCDHYRAAIHSSERAHDSMKAQQANIATPVLQAGGKYIPVFNSKRRQGGHRPAPGRCTGVD